MAYNIEDFLSVLTSYNLLGNLPREPLEVDIIQLERGKKMLVCPVCGSKEFSGELTIVAEVNHVRPSHDRIVGSVMAQKGINIKLVCGNCGSTPDFEELKYVENCTICGRPLGDIYYEHKTKTKVKAHPACLNNVGDWIYHNDNS